MPNLLLIHPATSRRLESITTSVPHALLISGARGSGKKFLAEYIASKVLGKEDITGHPFILKLRPVKQTISIEAVRELRSFLGRKTAGSGTIRRIVIIYDANLMTNEAQNALLKSLEEPPEDTMLMLTSSDINSLRATILSRVQMLRTEPIGKALADKALGQNFEQEPLTMAYYMSGGNASLLLALLDQKKDHPLVQAIDSAKQLLKLPTYERLIMADQLCKDKEQLALLLDGLQRVMMSVLHQAAIKNDKIQLARFHKLSNQVQLAIKALAANANSKLVISNLILQM